MKEYQARSRNCKLRKMSDGQIHSIDLPFAEYGTLLSSRRRTTEYEREIRKAYFNLAAESQRDEAFTSQ